MGPSRMLLPLRPRGVSRRYMSKGLSHTLSGGWTRIVVRESSLSSWNARTPWRFGSGVILVLWIGSGCEDWVGDGEQFNRRVLCLALSCALIPDSPL
jgi:hypothetical protein